MERREKMCEVLIRQLRSLESDATLPDAPDRSLSNEIELVERIRTKMITLLVKGSEHDEMDVIYLLGRGGYPFQVIESGLFYWDSGYIQTTKGRITIGR